MSNGSNDAYRQRIIEIIAPFARIYPVLTDQIYPIVSTVLLVLGTIGGILALGTLVSCRSMRSPSFNYHKALVSVNLIYCASNLLLKLVDNYLGETSHNQVVFRQFIIAFYSGVVSRVISSTCGYMVLYVSLFVSLDRCIALCVPFRYKEFNQRRVSFSLLAIAAILSVCFHSWAAPFERRIIECENSNETFYRWIREAIDMSDPAHNLTHTDQVYREMVWSKNIYNAVIRLSYPVLLTTLTLLACWKFRIQQENRASLRGSVNRQSTSQKRLTSLFYLMISVVILAYIQVLPSEGKRILDLIHPESQLSRFEPDVEKQLRNLRITLYGHKIMQIVVNTCTCIDRSLTFYVYFCLNPSFRKATANLWCKPCIAQLRKYTGGAMFEPASTASGLSHSVSKMAAVRQASLSSSSKPNGSNRRRDSLISYRGSSYPGVSTESFKVHLMGSNAHLDVPLATPESCRINLLDANSAIPSPMPSRVSFMDENGAPE